ncbi:hypothetical protein CPB84DRAFT_802316 [Gymnopilus junonius]|uniref:Uncharacterized protein n=1 Tax=Gymnopilus junonius TaxID=109634 RepID=A0A9P5NQP4_GYMJU|nr:hypothetical protein CPB84DRAFT_802316 [Gymnopilus junonius]
MLVNVLVAIDAAQRLRELGGQGCREEHLRRTSVVDRNLELGDKSPCIHVLRPPVAQPLLPCPSRSALPPLNYIISISTSVIPEHYIASAVTLFCGFTTIFRTRSLAQLHPLEVAPLRVVHVLSALLLLRRLNFLLTSSLPLKFGAIVSSMRTNCLSIRCPQSWSGLPCLTRFPGLRENITSYDVFACSLGHSEIMSRSYLQASCRSAISDMRCRSFVYFSAS